MKLPELPGRKSKLQRLIEAVEDSLDGTGLIKRTLGTVPTRKQLKGTLPDGARTAGLIVGGVAGLTAGSAAISSYRRHREEPDGDS
ncbi:MAG: hypothetical protein JOZ07_01425 [Solirubrobacterales bacterium]|nr:hypothetical protein [Solirubrobacterales bacterium]